MDPGGGNGRTGTTSWQQARSSVNDLVRVRYNTAHRTELEPSSTESKREKTRSNPGTGSFYLKFSKSKLFLRKYQFILSLRIQVRDHSVAGLEFPFQELLGKRAFDEFLQSPDQGAGAEVGCVTVFGEP